ncbi:eukaryotic translation initiation factor 5A [Salpingoeca rosetta]|uniref:Eukaryotic translation initiation factor 5A n=1 Tax=Salpingoeca rosetta (strain ATCC 50818 / BSB-021) TaxID=946362 RepID=F2UC19_SALR5|nr:eukaryotic translation initiation factor 5A [Salpingoeca rosetta]EGD74126.1 eukaryotic translation initiation factor 5A [Salpingoeca rosetta]|eukprot:XP_004993027.1 eukaryotic translation initiation factor 5A [Salpingoeca rosetta]
MGDGESGASKTTPIQCSALRKGGHVMIKGHPCKIVDMSTSKTGKHGHAKVNMTGVDIFTGKKHEDMCPSTHNMNVPVIKRTDWQLIDIDGEFLTLMDENGETREDLKKSDVDEEVLKDIERRMEEEEDMLVTVLAALDQEKVVGVKTYNV